MSTIKVDTIATRTGSGNITLSNNVASLTSAGAISGTNLTASGTLGVTGNTTVGGTLVNTGLITASAGVAIGGTGAANTLDDYEEGTFTPVSGVGSLSGNSGVYTKIGNIVRIGMKFTMPTSSNTNAATITGLPFTCFNDNAARAGITISWNSNGQGNSGLDFLIVENTTQGIFYLDGSSKSYSALSADTIYLGGTYPVA
jgi:hypothetical protein